MESQDVKLIKVGSATDIIKLCSSITASYEENKDVPIVIRSVGAGALNQAVKGVILSNRYFSKIGYKASLTPYFRDLPTQEGQQKISAIEMSLTLLRI